MARFRSLPKYGPYGMRRKGRFEESKHRRVKGRFAEKPDVVEQRKRKARAYVDERREAERLAALADEIEPPRVETVFHATTADITEFRPDPWRRATFFAPTPEGAELGAGGGARERLGDQPEAPSRPRRVIAVDLDTSRIQGLELTPAEQDWWRSRPPRTDEAGIEAAMRDRPKSLRGWYDVYTEEAVGEGFVYTQRLMPRKTFAEVNASGRDVYEQQVGGYSEGGETGAAKRAKAAGMAGFLISDEAGVSVAVVDPAAVRIQRPEPGSMAAMKAPTPQKRAAEIRVEREVDKAAFKRVFGELSPQAYADRIVADMPEGVTVSMAASAVMGEEGGEQAVSIRMVFERRGSFIADAERVYGWRDTDPTANTHPLYSSDQLRRDLKAPDLERPTRRSIEAELARREALPLTVTHVAFHVDKGEQGKGLGKRFLRNSMDVYHDMGVSRIDLAANIDVGGYAWAKYGFRYDTKMAEVAEDAGFNWKMEARERLSDVASQLTAEQRSQVDALIGVVTSKPDALWTISDMTDPVTVNKGKSTERVLPLGKAILINTGWQGTLRLDDEAAMARFYGYVDKGGEGGSQAQDTVEQLPAWSLERPAGQSPQARRILDTVVSEATQADADFLAFAAKYAQQNDITRDRAVQRLFPGWQVSSPAERLRAKRTGWYD